MSTREEIRSKADEMQQMSEKLHGFADYFKALAEKVERMEESQKQQSA